MSWRNRGRGIPDQIRQEELQHRQIEEKRRKEAEAESMEREHAFRELYPRVEKVCKQFTRNIGGKVKSSRTSWSITPPSRHLRDHLEKELKLPSYREVYVDYVGLFGLGITISAICFTKPFFMKANRVRANPNGLFPFKGKGYYRDLYKGEDVRWGKVSYYIPYDDFTEDELAEKLEEFTEEVLKRESSIHSADHLVWILRED